MCYFTSSHCYPLYLRVSSVLFMVSAMFFAASAASPSQNIRVYPAPEGLELSSAFTVAVAGREVLVYNAKVPPAEPIPRLTGSRSEFGFAAFASFDMRTSVDVAVTCPEPVKSIRILPTSFGIVPKVHGRTITIPIDPTLTGFQDGPDCKPYVIKSGE